MNDDFVNAGTDFSHNVIRNDNTVAQSSFDNASGSSVNVQQTISMLMNKCEQLQTQIDQNAYSSTSCSDLNVQTRMQSNESMEVFKVSTKVPPFYSEKPDMWFHQVEAQFRNNKIGTDQTKYDIVVSNLDPKYLDVVAHIIRDPPNENKYEIFKSTLIAEFQHSDEKRLTQLLQGINLGDRKPSVLLRHMREISKGIVNDNVLETLWSSKLPETLRAIIASINISLDEKAQTADKIYDRTKFETSSISNDTRNTSGSSVHAVDFSTQIADLTRQIDELSRKMNNNFRSRSRSRSKSHPRHRSSSRNGNRNLKNKHEEKKFEQCWYHFKFNENARNCTDWCKFNATFQQQQKNSSRRVAWRPKRQF